MNDTSTVLEEFTIPSGSEQAVRPCEVHPRMRYIRGESKARQRFWFEACSEEVVVLLVQKGHGQLTARRVEMVGKIIAAERHLLLR